MAAGVGAAQQTGRLGERLDDQGQRIAHLEGVLPHGGGWSSFPLCEEVTPNTLFNNRVTHEWSPLMGIGHG